jgi:H+-transporting ATPase
VDRTDFKSLGLDEAFSALGTSASGLSGEEAASRIAKYGYNEIPEKRRSRFLKFAQYFWGTLPWMIEAAAILSAALQHWDDFAIIVALLAVNAVLGFWQENKADNAIELLRKKLALSARVLRDGDWKVVPSRELVPGDVVRMRLGDIVPADIKLFNGDYLMLDESALTGESLPAEKHSSDVTYSGAVVRRGEMDAVVTGTGLDTYFGRTTRLVQEARTPSHLKRAVSQISDYLIIVAIVLVAIVLAVSVLRGSGFLPSLEFALVLLIASIPVALPAVFSVTMAVGAGILAGKKAIVTKLEAIEELAGVDVLCVDKTGTITRNEISVADVRPFGGFAARDVIGFAALASRREDGDPLELAIFQRSPEEFLKGYKVSKYTPFDPVTKKTEAICTENATGAAVVATKGAPQVMLRLVGPGGGVTAEVDAAVEEFARRGYRTIAVAESRGGSGLSMVGLIALYDPPREDSRATIAAARGLGLDVKMVTGDHVAIAREMCSEVGIGDRIVGAQALQDPATSGEEMERADALAEVFPEHKYAIVETLQGRGHIVAMTGDGVNDAPALRKADAGIAVFGATDAARSAADIVLTAPGLAVIIEAIRQSRIIFERMKNYAIYRIAETIRVLLFLSCAIVFLNIYPLTVLMLVLLALLNDFPIMMIAYDNVGVQDRPVKWDMREILDTSTLLGGLGLASSFGMLLLGIYVFHLDALELQTLMFLKMAVAGHMTIYLARSGRKHFWSRPFPANRLFVTTELTQVAATLVVVSGVLLTPISLGLAAFVWAYSFAFLVFNDAVKVWFVRRRNWDGEGAREAGSRQPAR